MDYLDALFAFATAAVVAALLVPLVRRFATAVGAVAEPSDQGLAERRTPLLGGLAMFAGTLVASAIWIPMSGELEGILIGASAIVLVGALDDIFDLPPFVKLLGQTASALIPVLAGVYVKSLTIPFVGGIDLGVWGAPLTLFAIVAVMNIINLSDGVDGLAAGVCAIAAVAFAVIAFDLGRDSAAILAALTAGAAVGFLFFNFNPASIFMGDCGSNLLGLLLGCVAVQGSVKTNAVIALVIPLVILAVPVLDTGFVVAKRIKYGRPFYEGDEWHFHHRFANIGFSQRKTVLYLYGWTLVMAGVAVAARFIPYSDDHGHFDLGWSLVMAAVLLVAVIASAYVVAVLEIFKFKRVRMRQLRAGGPATSEFEIEEAVAHELETGEFQAVEDRHLQ